MEHATSCDDFMSQLEPKNLFPVSPASKASPSVVSAKGQSFQKRYGMVWGYSIYREILRAYNFSLKRPSFLNMGSKVKVYSQTVK